MPILGYTPASRPIIGGAERIDPVDRVLRVVGHRTSNITLTPTGTDVSIGEGDLYRVGLMSQKAIGRYLVERQDAASATADPLGTLSWMLFDISELTADVFVANDVNIFSTEGGAATADADDTDILASAADIVAIPGANADLVGAGSDSRTTVFVATAANVTAAAAWAIPAALVEGNLYILDAVAASTRKYRITRVS